MSHTHLTVNGPPDATVLVVIRRLASRNVKTPAATTGSQNASRNPTCSRRIALAVRMTPNVEDVAPDGTDVPG